jgi:predicted transposase YbfD/YdcC
LGLQGCQIAIRLDFLRWSPAGDTVFQESRYYVTSLDPLVVSANDLLRWIRGHWQVENCLHFVKDRWWDEDRHWTSRPGLAAVFASLTNAAISVLRLWPEAEPILRAKTEKIQWNPAAALKILGF